MHRFVFSEGAVTLNDEQARIIRLPPHQNLRILAAAGSGKTTTLTARIAHLLTNHGARPEEIVLLTFTHNAAAVMCQRLEALVGSQIQRLLCGTFHALSQHILRSENPEALTDLYHVDELPLKALDFLKSTEGRAWIKGIKWLFIDEYQDINDVQQDFIQTLAAQGAAITIVGDDAQNIYSWRGSCVDYILNFHERFPNVADFQLITNYRSTISIVAVANSIMRYIPTLDHKELMTASPMAEQGDRPTVNYFARASEERDWVCDAALRAKGSTVILSKYNSVLFAFEAALLKLGVRVRFVTGDQELQASGTIFLSTFHGAKGLEWDNVFIARLNDEVFPQQKDEEGVLQERRLFYVAVTRARKLLTLSYSQNSKSLSRLVREIHRPLLVWRGLPNFELSALSHQISPKTVQDWVSILTGEDFRVIKQLRLLPKIDLGPSPSPGGQQYVSPYWWAEQGMSTEFYDFLRAFWFREVGILHPESGGCWDREAQSVIWTVKIAAEDAVFFEAHRSLFEDLATKFFGSTERGKAPPQIYYTEVLAAIPPATVNSLEQADLIRIIQIVHKMRTVLYNLRFANIALTDLHFANIRHSPPQEARCDLIEAWRIYTNGEGLSATMSRAELNAIYQVGLCRSLAMGRAGVLANLPGEREWSRIRPFLRELRTRIATETGTCLSRVVIDCPSGVDPVTAEADMIIGTTAWFFVGGDQSSELQRLERMVVCLITVHALRLAGHCIKRVCLFQIITGLRLEWSVEDWNGSLLTSYVRARSNYRS